MIAPRAQLGAIGPRITPPITVAAVLRYGGLLAAILVLLGFADASVFFSVRNAQNIAYGAASFGPLAIGLALVMSTGGIDLSVGASLTLCACVTGRMISNGQSAGLAVMVGLLVGVGCGVANGTLVGALALPPVVATFGSMVLIGGLAAAIADSQGIAVSFFSSLFTPGFGVPLAAATLLLGLAGWAVLALTPVAARVATLDRDRSAARSYGPQVRPGLIPIYALAGLLAALAGMITLGRLQYAESGSGSSFLTAAIAAAMIGGCGLLRAGPRSLPGAAVGAFLVAALTNELNLVGMSAGWQQVAIGAIILCALLSNGIAQFFLDESWE